MMINNVINDFRERGFSYLELPEDLFLDLLQITRLFYSLSISDRYGLVANSENGILGYVPSESELLGFPLNGFSGNKKRGYSSFDFLSDNSELLGNNRLFRCNTWTLENQDFRIKANQVYEALYRFASAFAYEVLSSVSKKENSNIFNQNNCLSLMRLLSYKKREVEYVSKEHTDYEFISFIVTDTEGLEVKDRENNWNTVPIKRNSAIILIGDMFEAITNGAFKSTLHRVRSSKQDRYSTIYFQGLPLNHLVQYKTNLIDINCTFGEHILPLLLSGALHLNSDREQISKDMNLRLININPFKKQK